MIRVLTLAGVVALAVVPTPANAAVSGSATWARLSPAASPSARYYSAMAYDGAGRLVLFGGFNDGTGFLADTWVWDGSAWTHKNPVHHPSPRDGAAMLYDSASNSVILFGGENGSSFADTWSWNGADWTQLSPATSPPKRAWAGMAPSPTTSAPIMFGGLDASGLADTWSWNGASPGNWTLLSPAHHPSARSDYAMDLDTVHHEIVLFGGGSWSGDHLTAQYGDTWTFDGSDWTRASTGGPTARIDPEAAFDARVGRVVLFGGFDNNANVYHQDTWSWTGSAWASQSATASPTKRDRGVMAYLPSTGKTVLFGGVDASGADLNDTWVLNLGAATAVPVVSTTVSSTRSFTVSWAAPGAPVRYTVQYAKRVKASSGSWVNGPWQSWQVVGPNVHSASFAGQPGTTYAFHAKATYAGGATTGYSASATAVVPVDDRSTAAVFSRGWVRRSAAGRFLSTITDTSAAGRTMSLRTAAHAFFLVGDKCAACGRLQIYVDGHLVKTVDTHAASLRARQLLFAKTFAGTRTHTLEVKTLGTPRRPRVGIDAIGVQR